MHLQQFPRQVSCGESWTLKLMCCSVHSEPFYHSLSFWSQRKTRQLLKYRTVRTNFTIFSAAPASRPVAQPQHYFQLLGKKVRITDEVWVCCWSFNNNKNSKKRLFKNRNVTIKWLKIILWEFNIKKDHCGLFDSSSWEHSCGLVDTYNLQTLTKGSVSSQSFDMLSSFALKSQFY